MKNLLIILSTITSIFLLSSPIVIINSNAILTDKEWVLYDDMVKTRNDIMKKYGITEQYLHEKGFLATIDNYGLTENEGKILEYKSLFDYKKDASKDDPCGQELYESMFDLLGCHMLEGLKDEIKEK